MSRLIPRIAALLTLTALPAMAAAPGTSLRGSPGSMVHQHEIAEENDYSFLRDRAAVRRLVDAGYLVRVTAGAGHRLANVSFPFARPEVATFIERLGVQYEAACGENLVVTSLTRPTALQPANAHRLSVHPAGMAVDLRVSSKASCRKWLEGTLLSLEGKGLLDATREHRPPHYHVAVFPEAYAAHVERLTDTSEAEPAPAEVPAESRRAATDAPIAVPGVNALRRERPKQKDRTSPWELLFALGLVAGVTLQLKPRRG